MRSRMIGATMTVLASVAAVVAPPALASTLPTLALDPAPSPSIWSGLWVGTELSVTSVKGHKGLIGGGVSAGYNRAFANNVVLGIEGSAGYAPGWGWGRRAGLRGYDYLTTSALVGYDMGRVMPYVTTGVVLDKAHFGLGDGFHGMDTVNALFNERGNLDASGRVGAGVVYAVTPDIHVGVEVSVANGPAAAFP